MHHLPATSATPGALVDRIVHPPRRAIRILLASIGVAVTAAMLLIATTPTSVYARDVFGAMRAPGDAAFIVGHRGDRSQAPENTLPALERALDDLAYVETDVQLTSDEVPVLFHDTTLERVTGDPRTVGDVSFEELRTLDAGAWYGSEFAGVGIPTLVEFLEQLVDRPEAHALVELKADWKPTEVRIVLDAIERHGVRNRIIMQSFSIETLQSLQRVSPTTPKIMLTRELPADPVPLADMLGLIGFGTTAKAVKRVPEAVERLHAAGISVLCYTLNSEDHWQEVSELGVDGIITDTPSDLDDWLAATAPGT